MCKVAGGYTIMELIIVLAVSTLILGSAILTINGSTARTQFAASMRDINSKTQDWINDVTDGFTGGDPASYYCTITGSPTARPYLISPRITNPKPDCVFIGKVLQLTTGPTTCGNCEANQDSKIYVYALFGQRLKNGALIDTMSDALPTPMIGPWRPPVPKDYRTADTGFDNLDLTETYSILNGASVVKISGSPVSSGLFGFFNSFNGSAISSNGAQTLNSYVYPLSGNAAAADTADGTTVIKCLQLATATCAPKNLNNVKICLASNRDKELAVLTISSDNGLGATTKLDFVKTCP